MTGETDFSQSADEFAARGVSESSPKGGAPLSLTGWLLPASSERARLLLGDLCFDFAIESVQRIEPAVSVRSVAEIPLLATVELTPRPIILAIGPAGPWRGLFRTGPRPFALTARPSKVSVTGHDAYLKREAAYLRAHGLDWLPDRD